MENASTGSAALSPRFDYLINASRILIRVLKLLLALDSKIVHHMAHTMTQQQTVAVQLCSWQRMARIVHCTQNALAPDHVIITQHIYATQHPSTPPVPRSVQVCRTPSLPPYFLPKLSLSRRTLFLPCSQEVSVSVFSSHSSSVDSGLASSLHPLPPQFPSTQLAC